MSHADLGLDFRDVQLLCAEDGLTCLKPTVTFKWQPWKKTYTGSALDVLKRHVSGGQLRLPSVPSFAQVTLSPFDCSKADATTKAAALPFSWLELFPLECGATLPAVRHIRG